MSAPTVVGIDVGGTKLAGVAVAGEQLLAERRRQLGTSSLPDQVIDLVRELAAVSGRPIAAIGIAVPGQVDTGSGIIELAVNLAVRGLPIGSLVSEALGVPCAVEHDARAVAAWLAEQEGSPADIAYLSVGTGISAGVVVDGRLVRGGDGLAGEIGHVLADPAGPICACGLVGCLETVASGPAVARIAAEAVAGGADTSLPADPTTADVYRAAMSGDPTARAVVDRSATHLAAAVRGLALAFGVARIVVGGGVTHAGEAFARPLADALERERAGSILIARALPSAAVRVLDDDRPLGAFGAAAVARERLTAAVPRANEEVGTR
jgi:glucokinase